MFNKLIAQDKDHTSIQTIHADPLYPSLKEDFCRSRILDYFMRIHQLCEQLHRPGSRAIYGAAGIDLHSLLLLGNAQDNYLVSFDYSRLGITAASIEQALQDTKETCRALYPPDYGNGYDREERMLNFESLADSLLYRLARLHVPRSSITVDEISGYPQIRFPWRYPGSTNIRTYTLTFISADITMPSRYPSFLNHILAEGYDLYLQKAAQGAPLHYTTTSNYMKHLITYLDPQGLCMTDDVANFYTTLSPELHTADVLAARFTMFGLHQHERAYIEDTIGNGSRFSWAIDLSHYFPDEHMEQVVIPEIIVIEQEILDQLDRFGRRSKEPMAGLSYGWRLNIRRNRS